MAILNLLARLPLFLFDTPGDAGGGGGTPAAAGTPAAGASAGTPAAGTPSAQGSPAGTPAQAAAGTATSTQYTYAEDRSRWIPPHRLSEETTKRQQIEQQLADAQRRIAALAGVQPPDPNADKMQQVKDAFFQMFPQFKHLASLTDEQIQQLIQTPQHVARVSEAESREWTRLGRTSLNTVYEQVADALGADSLTDDQKADLQSGFSNWFQSKVRAELDASGGETSATLDRYEQQDPTLIAEFVKRFTSGWVDPARRKVTQQAVSRARAVPNSQGRAPVSSLQRPEKFNTLDERLDYAAKLAKERGVQFGRD